MAGLEDLVAEGRPIRPLPGGLLSAVPAGRTGSTTYRQARTYDRVIGSAAYLRAVWSASPSEFADFTGSALAAGDGPFLDAGCGTAVFTADAYRASDRRLLLTDLSEEMLGRAQKRLPPGSADATLLQADLFDLPFAPASFGTVGCFGVLHCIDDLDGALAALAGQVAPNGRLYVSALGPATARSKVMCRLLDRAGEFATPRTAGEFEAAVARHLEVVSFERRGSMAYAVAGPR